MSFTPRTPEELAATWPAELDHVSASSLKQFARCPEQWRQVKLLGRRQRPAAAVIQGSADHHAIAQHFKAQADQHVGLALDQVQDAFVTDFDRRVADAGPSEIDWGKYGDPKKAAAKVKDEGVKLVGLYHQDVTPYFQATHVETPFQLELDHVPIRVDGYIDAQGVYMSPLSMEPTSDPVIVERKTAARGGMNPESVLQGRVYQLAVPADVDVHVSVKRGVIEWGTPGLRIRYSDRLHEITVAQVQHALRQMAFFYVQYGPDRPWPGNITHPWACNYCGFRDDCPWWDD